MECGSGVPSLCSGHRPLLPPPGRPPGLLLLEGSAASRKQRPSNGTAMPLGDRAWDFVVGDTDVSLRYLWSSNVCHTCRLFRVSGAQRARAGLAGNSGKKGFPLMMGPNRSLVLNSWLCRPRLRTGSAWLASRGGGCCPGTGREHRGGCPSEPRPRGAAAVLFRAFLFAPFLRG